MFNLNRRHTEALEKAAAAKKRLASAEEAIARDLGVFLEGDEAIDDIKGDDSKRKTVKKHNPDARKE